MLLFSSMTRSKKSASSLNDVSTFIAPVIGQLAHAATSSSSCLPLVFAGIVRRIYENMREFIKPR